MMRVEALNHALAGVPEDQVRYHLCWGSWHGPHLYDIPLADIVDVMLAVNAQTYLFEAANVRHEHEHALWERVKLPDGKIRAP
jgi:5-methyltetrahydropteroyltriglutamate--homocysteine methyltransferase